MMRAVRVASAVFLLLCLNLVLCGQAFPEQKETKTVTAGKAENYVYLPSEQGSLPLDRTGEAVPVEGIPVGPVCLHGGLLWSKHFYYDPVKKRLFEHSLFDTGGFQADGLCSDGKLLWVLDNSKRKLRGLQFERDEEGRFVSSKLVAIIDLPCESPTAVTFAKGRFHVLDTAEKGMFVLDLRGSEKDKFSVPSESVADIAYDGRYYWAVDGKKKAAWLYEEHGVIILFLPLPFVPAGIACNGRSIWITSVIENGTNKKGLRATLFRYTLNKGRKYTLESWMEADVCYRVTGNETCHIALPENSNRQEVLSEIAFNEAAQIVEDNWIQKAARFSGKGETSVRARIHRVRYNIIPEKVGGFSRIPVKLRKAYLIDGDMLKLTSETVRAAKQDVEQLIKKWKKKRNPYWVSRCAYEYFIRRAHYERIPGWADAPTLLKRGKGTCSPLSFAFVAICRALGIPARFSAGTRYRGKDPCVDAEFHRWCEVYLPGYGWVPIDPSATGKSPSPLVAIAHWGTVPHTDLVMTRGGGGSTIFGWAYNCAGGKALANWSNIRMSK